MSPAIPENERAGPVQTVPAAPGSHHTKEMICPCCNQPYLRRMLVVECSGCGFRKIESETEAEG
jgi:hypothetical protein